MHINDRALDVLIFIHTWHGLRVINYQFAGKSKNNTILFLHKNQNVYFMLV